MDGPVWCRHSVWKILTGPFQLGMFCRSMAAPARSTATRWRCAAAARAQPARAERARSLGNRHTRFLPAGRGGHEGGQQPAAGGGGRGGGQRWPQRDGGRRAAP